MGSRFFRVLARHATVGLRLVCLSVVLGTLKKSSPLASDPPQCRSGTLARDLSGVGTITPCLPYWEARRTEWEVKDREDASGWCTEGASRGPGPIQLSNFGESTQFLEPGVSFLLKQGQWMKDDDRASQLRPLSGPDAASPASLPSQRTDRPTDRPRSPPPPSRATRPRSREARPPPPPYPGGAGGGARLGVGPPAPGRDLGASNPLRAHTGA